MFTLKNINVKSRNKMAIFFEQLAKQTISAALSVAIEGGVNILDDTVSFAADYTTEVVKEVQSEKKLKPIKTSKNQFEAFKPKDEKGPKTVKLSFMIGQDYLDSDNTIVLSIDSWNHVRKSYSGLFLPAPKKSLLRRMRHKNDVIQRNFKIR